MSALATVYRTGMLQMKNSFARSMYRFCLLFQPIIYSFITYMMFKSSDGRNFISFVVLGSGILTLWSCICFSSAGDIDRERYMGTLEIIYGAPTNFKIIVCGKILGNTLLGFIPLAISFAMARFVFNEKVYIPNPMLLIVSLGLTVVAFLSISLIFSAFFTMSRSAGVLMNVLEYPIFILCGFIVPVEVLPEWILPLCHILSPTWAMKLLRMSVEGAADMRLFASWTINLLAISIVYLFIAYFLFNKIDKMIRVTGSLGVK